MRDSVLTGPVHLLDSLSQCSKDSQKVFDSWAKDAPRLSRVPTLFVRVPPPGIEPGSPASQADILSIKLRGQVRVRMKFQFHSTRLPPQKTLVYGDWLVAS